MRAIASTVLKEKGIPPDVIEAALAHIDTYEIRRAYNRAQYLELRREMMLWWGECRSSILWKLINKCYWQVNLNRRIYRLKSLAALIIELSHIYEQDSEHFAFQSH